jgi:hypothetical protein
LKFGQKGKLFQLIESISRDFCEIFLSFSTSFLGPRLEFGVLEKKTRDLFFVGSCLSSSIQATCPEAVTHMHAHAALACCRIALPCLACAAPLLPPPYLLFLSSTCFRVELMLCVVASPWLPPLLRASSLEFHRRSSFGAMSCLLPRHQPPPTATSTPVSATVDRMSRCLAVRSAGPCRIIERCPKPEPSPSSCHTGPELPVQPWLRPIMCHAATSLN